MMNNNIKMLYKEIQCFKIWTIRLKLQINQKPNYKHKKMNLKLKKNKLMIFNIEFIKFKNKKKKIKS